MRVVDALPLTGPLSPATPAGPDAGTPFGAVTLCHLPPEHRDSSGARPQEVRRKGALPPVSDGMGHRISVPTDW